MESENVVHIGLASIGCPRPKYTENLSFSELIDTFHGPPRPATIRRWRQALPKDFVFSIRAQQFITHEPGPDGYRRVKDQPQGPCGHFRSSDSVRAAYQATLAAANDLEARAVVFDTPASFTPTRSNQKQLELFFEQADRQPALSLVWRPAGVWTAGQIQPLCDAVGLVWSVDPVSDDDAISRLVPGPMAYFSLRRPFYSDDDYDRILTLASSFETTFIMFDNINGYFQALAMTSLLG